MLDSAQLQVDVNLDADLLPGSRIATPAGEVAYDQVAAIEDRSGNHHPDGIFFLRGPNVRRGHHVHGVRLQDVTPTLLYLEGKAVGADMDGQVLYDVVDPAFVGERRRQRTRLRPAGPDPARPLDRRRRVDLEGRGDPQRLRRRRDEEARAARAGDAGSGEGVTARRRDPRRETHPDGPGPDGAGDED